MSMFLLSSADEPVRRPFGTELTPTELLDEYGAPARLLFCYEYGTHTRPVWLVAAHGTSGGVASVTYVDLYYRDGNRGETAKLPGHLQLADAEAEAMRLAARHDGQQAEQRARDVCQQDYAPAQPPVASEKKLLERLGFDENQIGRSLADLLARRRHR